MTHKTIPCGSGCEFPGGPYLLLLNRQKRPVGIVSLGDVATETPPRHAGEALKKVSESGGMHGQSLAGIR